MEELKQALLKEIAELYALEPASAETYSQGNMNESHSVSTPDGDYVIRLAPEGTERGALEASMLVLEGHASAGSPVISPLRSARGALVETVRDAQGGPRLVTVHAKATGNSFDFLSPGQIPDEGFTAYGRALARFHETALGLKAPEGGIPPWQQGGGFPSMAKVQAFEDRSVAARYLERLERCLAIPASAGKSGLVHGDLHFSNIIYDAVRNEVTFCDFDDTCRAPFALDLAMLVFDLSVILQCDDGPDEKGRVTAILIDAYRSCLRDVVVEAEDVACFVDLIEAGCYMDWLECWTDAPGSTGWLQLFFDGRRQRLARDRRIFIP